MRGKLLCAMTSGEEASDTKAAWAQGQHRPGWAPLGRQQRPLRQQYGNRIDYGNKKASRR
jgi:hypothetical protein